LSTVVTKNGCTEKGINRITTIQQLLNKDYFEESLNRVWNNATDFKRIARIAIEETLIAV
jgi:hypothetical protein